MIHKCVISFMAQNEPCSSMVRSRIRLSPDSSFCVCVCVCVCVYANLTAAQEFNDHLLGRHSFVRPDLIFKYETKYYMNSTRMRKEVKRKVIADCFVNTRHLPSVFVTILSIFLAFATKCSCVVVF